MVTTEKHIPRTILFLQNIERNSDAVINAMQSQNNHLHNEEEVLGYIDQYHIADIWGDMSVGESGTW